MQDVRHVPLRMMRNSKTFCKHIAIIVCLMAWLLWFKAAMLFSGYCAVVDKLVA